MPWVKAILSEVYGFKGIVDTGAFRLIVIDGSTIQQPGATETTYRLHIAMDLVAMRIIQVHISTEKTGESLDLYNLQEGDVVIVDRGYNSPKALVPFLSSGKEVILRYNPHSMSLYEFDSNWCRHKIQWKEKLESLGGKSGHFKVYLCYEQQRIEVTLHAIRLSEEDAQKARRNVRRRAKKRGKAPSAEALVLCDWVFVLSSLPVTILSTTNVGALYRVRWQVELLIKRMKSILGIDKLRAFKDSPLSDLYLHGKLLWISVVEKITCQRFEQAKRRMDQVGREVTDWRLWESVQQTLKACLTDCFTFRAEFVQDMIKSVKERPRKRTLQSLPSRVVELIEWCRGQGMSLV